LKQSFRLDATGEHAAGFSAPTGGSPNMAET
jgi:hypothetical protein